MASKSQKMARWVFLDHLLSRGTPVSFMDIYREYQGNPDLRLIDTKKFDSKSKEKQENDLVDSYQATLRKDLSIFKAALKANGLSDMLMVCRGATKKLYDDTPDNRTKTICYKENGFSIIPYLTNEMTDGEFKSLVNVIDKLKTILDEPLFEEVRFSLLSRLEMDYDKGLKCVEYEDNRRLKGRCWLPVIYNAIQERNVLEVTYHPFSKEQYTCTVHPYLLKQYNGRWFMFGLQFIGKRKNPYESFPLDRIEKIRPVEGQKYDEGELQKAGDSFGYSNYKDYFDVRVGVSRGKAPRRKVVLRINDIDVWGRITTNPLNTLQIKDDGFHLSEGSEKEGYGRVELDVFPNPELYSKILSFGEGVVVEDDEYPEIREEMVDKIYKISRQYPEIREMYLKEKQ